MPNTDFRLEGFLPYLVHRVGARLADGFGVEFDAAGVSLQEWRILAVLHEYGAQPIGDIARRTNIPASSMTRLIGVMESRDLVRRERPTANQRTVHVKLLPAGRKTAEALIPRVIAYEEELGGCFTEAELHMLKTLLARLFHSIAEDSEERLAG